MNAWSYTYAPHLPLSAKTLKYMDSRINKNQSKAGGYMLPGVAFQNSTFYSQRVFFVLCGSQNRHQLFLYTAFKKVKFALEKVMKAQSGSRGDLRNGVYNFSSISVVWKAWLWLTEPKHVAVYKLIALVLCETDLTHVLVMNYLVFIIEEECVYRAVRAESSCVIQGLIAPWRKDWARFCKQEKPVKEWECVSCVKPYVAYRSGVRYAGLVIHKITFSGRFRLNAVSVWTN